MSRRPALSPPPAPGYFGSEFPSPGKICRARARQIHAGAETRSRKPARPLLSRRVTTRRPVCRAASSRRRAISPEQIDEDSRANFHASSTAAGPTADNGEKRSARLHQGAHGLRPIPRGEAKFRPAGTGRVPKPRQSRWCSVQPVAGADTYKSAFGYRGERRGAGRAERREALFPW